MITAFVAMMMIAVEYLNVLTRGGWQRGLQATRWTQYLVAVGLGAVPGCLGAFVVVTLYTHRAVSLGALTAAMIATSGDEAFVMLAMFPAKAAILTLGIAVVGFVVGVLVDRTLGRSGPPGECPELVLHEEEACNCFDVHAIGEHIRRPGRARGLLVAGCVLFAGSLSAGVIGPPELSWIRVTLLMLGLFGLFVVVTVPEHFLREHLWQHVARKHVPRIFFWTFGALVTMALLDDVFQADALLRNSRWAVLGVASLLGVVPESGPHLLIVTMYDRGLVPLSTLVASSIVQDGHGMLPLLACSRLDFARVKGINLLTGLVVGGILMSVGW
ncbi:arsenic efflux protein [bacterium]|nr:arsenic efflux protein [bacterium]